MHNGNPRWNTVTAQVSQFKGNMGGQYRFTLCGHFHYWFMCVYVCLTACFLFLYCCKTSLWGWNVSEQHEALILWHAPSKQHHQTAWKCRNVSLRTVTVMMSLPSECLSTTTLWSNTSKSRHCDCRCRQCAGGVFLTFDCQLFLCTCPGFCSLYNGNVTCMI